MTIDWDATAANYHNTVLSPYAAVMVEPDTGGRCRNPVLNYLQALDEGVLAAMSIADFGCGPGNLIAHLPRGVRRLTCIDQSPVALDMAQSAARRRGIEVDAVRADIGSLDGSRRYDLIVSVNAVLPATRAEVYRQLRAISRSLAPDGRLIAILPSFDTTEYLRGLWRRYYEQRGMSERDIADRLRAFERSRLMDRERLSYADDGRNAQCYHTEASIAVEFPDNGLTPVRPPEKVYYPWNLARQFGYGWFPDAREEIWDWFVIATANR